MAVKGAAEWRKLPVALTELCIDTTLRCGQSFRWRKLNDEWTCALHGRILSLRQDPTHIHYKVTWPDQPLTPPASQKLVVSQGDRADTEALLRNYFSLHLDLGGLYQQWSSVDPNFRKRAPKFGGVRILTQDAWEALIAFICSSNNNISRISQMVHKLCKHYGPPLGVAHGETVHDFPTPQSLTGKAVEAHLRDLGFGYRAKYIADTARMIANEKPVEWLESLRNPDHPGLNPGNMPRDRHTTYKQAHEELLSLSGVGPKVADCVCLMGLGWGESVPVDTHVWQIAQRDYKFGMAKSKSLNKVMYDAVGDHFRDLWGKYAGWAHSVLFTADLREFSDRAAATAADKVVKVEEVKQQALDDVKPSGVRKRKMALESSVGTDVQIDEVKTEVKTEVKVEEVQDGAVVSLRTRAKRRRA